MLSKCTEYRIVCRVICSYPPRQGGTTRPPGSSWSLKPVATASAAAVKLTQLLVPSWSFACRHRVVWNSVTEEGRVTDNPPYIQQADHHKHFSALMHRQPIRSNCSGSSSCMD